MANHFENMYEKILVTGILMKKLYISNFFASLTIYEQNVRKAQIYQFCPNSLKFAKCVILG
jgi:hypothetical protein